MAQLPNKPNPSPRSDRSNQPSSSSNSQNRAKQNDLTAEGQRNEDIVTTIVKKIDGFKIGLREYKIREIVEDTNELGKILAVKGDKGLKTNQIRKFLDAINRFKVQQRKNTGFSENHRDELHILRYQLAYAAARQKKKDSDPVEPLKKVLEAAIKQTGVTGNDLERLEDFNRLVQLVESIVAYHKAAGGKDQ
jgi:CRISPR-associated protein Csm2